MWYRQTDVVLQKEGVKRLMWAKKEGTQLDLKISKTRVIITQSSCHTQVWEYPPQTATWTCRPVPSKNGDVINLVRGWKKTHLQATLIKEISQYSHKRNIFPAVQSSWQHQDEKVNLLCVHLFHNIFVCTSHDLGTIRTYIMQVYIPMSYILFTSLYGVILHLAVLIINNLTRFVSCLLQSKISIKTDYFLATFHYQFIQQYI